MSTNPAAAQSTAPQSEHTPGPWYSRTQYDGITVVRTVRGPDGRDWSLAQVYATLGNPEANGRLMAAAPELLAAVGDLLGALELRGLTKESDWPHDTDLYDRAFRAYQRATGERREPCAP